jgi:glyoxylase I family protein
VLQQAASLDCQIVQGHLQLRNGRADFWVLSNFLLQRLQDLLSTFDMRLGRVRIRFGIAFARSFHGCSLSYFSLLLILRIRRLPGVRGKNWNLIGARAISAAMTEAVALEYARPLGEAMFNRVHHIAIICSDYARSKRFYVEVLGLKIVREIYREERRSFKLDLQVGEQYQLELFSFPNPPARPTSPEACGLRHIAFEVGDVQDVAHRLKELGVVVEPIRVDEFTGKSFTFFRDPDDLPIEIYEQ